ncbi:PREDICTED: chromatin assembly factor 1 subunit A-B-like isoform X3 [Branchiostoma belcheri]|uniref:Chromatin assembly factor 1 subunit A-B-like isoform X1 n=1 Tax=Branchiostoma belcheri TaxID=7741 RepID=A0A6P4YCL4_BRABE|nr:PREDICTED: chromatin assembly factor 1 subunit A-B-like isoform X1 [Branchiostoma belcheri]XP_019626900.1 PREDICTED: chromatin assembly factor 1 subunit A-B-like isoform X2 [Branchiostoma belcheri]XP_019626901.1 PREDICTED: chromatin assembly factor 1 subunit A-B-like isoform X3 [Branchiostoma belcheri]
MLGECMPQNPSRMGDSKAEKVADGRSQDKNILSSPPSSKKLKQARLPFKVVSPLNGPMSPNTPNTKKRKHSNEEVASPKTPKLSSIHSPCKSAEKVSNQQLKEKEKSKASVVENAAKSVHEGENEVSSSSEMFPAPKSPAIKATSKNEKAKTIDSFLQTTQQPLVSTSNEDEAMMIDLAMTDSDPEEEMAGKQASPVRTPQVQEAVEAERCSPSVASSLQKNEGQSDVQESDTISMAIESVIQSSTVSSVKVTKTQPEEEAVASKNDQSPDSSNKAVSSTQATTSPPTHKESSPVSKSILDMFRYAEDRKAERNKDMPVDQETMPQHTSKDEVVKVTSPVHGKPEGCTSESSPVKAEVEASKDKITSPPTPSFTSPKGPSTKPRVKTPKQLAREAEQQKKREEKEREKQEKQRIKDEERAEKERLRSEAKRQKELEKEEMRKKKEEEKRQKELEKQKQKEAEEKERQEKLRIREEERKKKQEAIEAKLEEKKKKEEEKQKQEEEKKKVEEEKARKQQKVKAAFQSFFVKPKVDPAETKEEQQPVGAFMPFEVKKDMKLAPCVRVENLDLTRVDQGLQKQSCTELYLAELKKHHVPKTAGKTFPRPSPNSLEADDVMVVESSPPTRHVRMKLLQFHENYRPAYYGTWNKTSKQLNPRNPFKKDEDLLDYEFDSDDEWEEEEPGESISHSEGEKDDSDEDADSDLEDFFVPHGHLSEDEGCEDEDEPSSPSARKAKELARQRAFEADRKKQMKYMKAVVIGCLWSCDITEDNQSDIRRTLEEYKVCAFATMPIHVAGPEESIAAVDKTPKQKVRTAQTTTNKQPVPEEAFPDLIRLMHGNPKGIKSLVREFREFWYLKQKGENKDESGNKVDNKEQKSAEVAMETSEIVPSGPDVEMKEADSASNQSASNESSSRAAGPDVTEAAAPSPTADPSPAAAPQQHKYSISKRQLEMTMMSIAVREKRADYHKTCWYVHQEVQTKHNITDLPIPNKWTYVTKQKSDSPKSRGATPGSAGAKKDTPAKDERPVTPSVPGANIRQFVQPMSPAALFKSPQQKEQEKQATPTTSPGPAGILNFFKKAGKAKESGKEDAGYHADSEDDDCMIVEEASTPPPKSVSSQSTGAASSSGNNSCLPKEASEKAGDTEVLQVRDGTSQDVSFVKTQTSSGQEAMEVTLH